MLRILLSVLLIQTATVLHGQEQDRIDRILGWVEENRDIDIDGTLDTLEFALNLAKKNRDYPSEVEVLLLLSQFTLTKLSNVSKAAEYLEEIKRIADLKKDDPWILGSYHNGKGVLYYYEGTDKEKAFDEFRRSREIMRKAGLKDDPRMLNNYALAFLSEQNALQALKLFKRSRDIEIESKADRSLCNLFLETIASNIGICYIYLGKQDSAEYYLRQAVFFADKTPGYADDFNAYVYLGVFFEEHGKNDDALAMLRKAENEVLERTCSKGREQLFQGSSRIV